MKIVVYGGTGMVGSRVVETALQHGHEVTAVSRSGKAPAGATGVAAELGDVEALNRLAAEADAVVFAVPPDRTGGPAQPVIDAHRAIIADRPGARLLIVGGAGSLQVGDALRGELPDYPADGLLKDTPGFPAMFLPEASAFTTILDDYRAAEGLDWTLVSPSPEIAPGERTGYLLGGDALAGMKVSAEDFADAIVDELETPAHRNARFTVASH